MDQPYMKGQMKNRTSVDSVGPNFKASEMDVYNRRLWKAWVMWSSPYKGENKDVKKNIYWDIEYTLIASGQLWINQKMPMEMLKKLPKNNQKHFEASKPSGCFRSGSGPEPHDQWLGKSQTLRRLSARFAPRLGHPSLRASGKLCWKGFVTIEPRFGESWICFHKEINFDPIQRFHSSPFGECFSRQCFASNKQM